MILPDHALISTILDAYQAELFEALGDCVVGVYVVGSLVTGGFHYGISDIDLVVVTAGKVSETQFGHLGSLHASLRASSDYTAEALDVSYLSVADLRVGGFGSIYPAIWRGTELHREEAASELVIHRHILHNHGVALYGPMPNTLCNYPSSRELRQVMLQACDSEFRHCPNKIDSMQSFSFWILTICRALYTVEKASIASKQEGAVWTIARWPVWSDLIELALKARLDPKSMAEIWPTEADAARQRARNFVDFAVSEIETQCGHSPLD